MVFFDEFQEVAGPQRPYGAPDRLTKRMRAIFQRATGVNYLFAGSLEHMMRDLFTPTHRALHQFGGFFDLRPIETDAWLEGLAERYAADDCTVAAGAEPRPTTRSRRAARTWCGEGGMGPTGERRAVSYHDMG